LDEALAYARQHSPRLAATRQGVATQQAAVAAARDQRLPRADLGASICGSNHLTQTALGFPLTSLADVPQDQPFAQGHVNGVVLATLPIYTGGRISSATKLAGSERDLAQTKVRDVERDLDFDVTSTYASLVQLDRDIEAAQESVKALQEGHRVIAEMLQTGKVARVDLLKKRYTGEELRGILREGAESLTPFARIVFLLRDVAHLKPEEIADLFRLSVPHVKSHLLRGRLQLREHLNKYFKSNLKEKAQSA
jgi:DNA-directed RNA polymerase specialized sigma24 family protein